MMKSRVTAAVIAGALSLSLAACTQGSQTAQNEDANTISFIGDEGAIKEQIAAAAGPIHEETGLVFEGRVIQSTENYQQVIRSSLGTDSATDLVKWWNGYRLKDLARGGKLLNLTDVWNGA